MLQERGPTEFVAICEDCEEPSISFLGSREMAVLRLMRSRWRVRTDTQGTRTWCPTCQTTPSIPIMKSTT